uniref:Aminotransferase-like plant mobile domain-containing protein n=1 Tax=Fagus sylvatica TaxID=28930 RepID=A0A2N9IPR3_FAGSY
MIHADIVGVFGKFPSLMRLQVDRGLLEALASFWDPTHCCFSIGEVDLVPTLGGILLTKYFSRSDFPVELARDFIARQARDGRNSAINAFKIAFAGIFLFPTSAGRIDLGVIPVIFSEGRSIIPAILCETVQVFVLLQETGRGDSDVLHSASFSFGSAVICSTFYRLQTPYHFERHTVSQTVKIVLPFTGNSRDWALYLLDLPLGEWSWKVTRGPAVWRPWTHCALFDGVPLPGVWGCTGLLPQPCSSICGGSSPGSRLSGKAVLSELPLVSLGGLLFLERELEEARAELSSLRLARASEREESAARVESLRSTLHHNSVAVANLRRDLEAQRGNVSTLRAMNEFIREQLEISEDAKDQLEETLAETREQLETEQAERTRDIVALRRALDASEEALTSARTSMGAMRVQISVLQGDNGVLQTELDLVHDALESNASWLNQEGFPVVTALHQINQVMDSLGARARAVLEEHDEGDPALSTALGRFCRETCIRLGH